MNALTFTHWPPDAREGARHGVFIDQCVVVQFEKVRVVAYRMMGHNGEPVEIWFCKVEERGYNAMAEEVWGETQSLSKCRGPLWHALLVVNGIEQLKPGEFVDLNLLKKIMTKPLLERCENCNGTGEGPSPDLICDDCKGQGGAP